MAGSFQNNLRLLAARYLHRQVRKLAAHLQGARNGKDVEHVHQARVASRRLRAGLKLFAMCFPPASVTRWRKKIRRVTTSLGAARDADVQILFLKEYLSTVKDPKLRRGVTALLKQRRAQRRRLQNEVVQIVGKFRHSGVADELARAIEKLKQDGRSAQTQQTPYPLARKLVSEALPELLIRQRCLEHPDLHTAHHEMRISAKRLRYTLEAVAPAYADGLKPAIKAAKHMQTLLGDMHDCDAWVDVVQQAIAEATGDEAAGLHHLKDNRVCRRRVLYRRALKAWSKISDDAVWTTLVAELRAHAPEADPPAETQVVLTRSLRIRVREAGN